MDDRYYLDIDTGELMMKSGGIGDTLLGHGDLPDEMFEDMLHSFVKLKDVLEQVQKNIDHVPADQRYGYTAKGYGCWDAKRCQTPHPHYADRCTVRFTFPELHAIFSGTPLDLDWDPDEEVTKPMGQTADQLAEVRAQRKAAGVCPECGDTKRESTVGICRDHGKFLG